MKLTPAQIAQMCQQKVKQILNIIFLKKFVIIFKIKKHEKFLSICNYVANHGWLLSRKSS